MARYVNRAAAQELADAHNLDLDRVGGIDWWKYAINSELETLAFLLDGGRVVLAADRKESEVAACVAVRKLTQYPDWYKRLKATEDAALRHWRSM